jgi:hypothetical protein
MVSAHVVWRLGGDQPRKLLPSLRSVRNTSARSSTSRRASARVPVAGQDGARTEIRGAVPFERSVAAIGEQDIKAWLIDWDRALKTKANYHALSVRAARSRTTRTE